MTRGQESLMMELEAPAAAAAAAAGLILDVSKLIVQRASPERARLARAIPRRMEKEAKGAERVAPEARAAGNGLRRAPRLA